MGPTLNRVTIPEDVVSEILDGQAVVLNLRTGCYHTLNASGTRLWELLERDGDVETATQTLLAEYDTSEETLRADVDKVLSELQERGLVLGGAAG
ncbi:MAG: HPr-rel-A system PqqD family peptide chaperone [Polyangiaceae bacterium]|nr:HPr-rel-A system PqqD family peptide chaperone [Polyangiaceae bacterium]